MVNVGGLTAADLADFDAVVRAVNEGMARAARRDAWEAEWEALTGVPWREWGTVTIDLGGGRRYVLSGRIVRVSIERETVEGIPNGAWVTYVPTGRRSVAVVLDTPQRGDA